MKELTFPHLIPSLSATLISVPIFCHSSLENFQPLCQFLSPLQPGTVHTRPQHFLETIPVLFPISIFPHPLKYKLPSSQNSFLSLCKIFIYLSFLAEAFWCHVHHYKCLAVMVEQFHWDSQALIMVYMAPKSFC